MKLLAIATGVLDSTFLLGLGGILLGVGTLILDSSQQIRLQDFLNAVTLRLIDLNILTWYPRLRKYKVNVPIFFFIIAVELILFARAGKLSLAKGVGPYLIIFVFQWPVYDLIVGFLAKRKTGFQFCVWMLSLALLITPCLYFSLYVFIIWAGSLKGVWNVNPQLIVGHLRATLVATLVAFMLFAEGVFVCLLAAVLTAMGLCISVCVVLLNVVRGLLWRIVTYEKGAWAALWIVATAVVGLIDLIVRRHKSG